VPEYSDRVAICGLTFFVPREIRAPGKLADRVLSGWLPLREIADARDVAVGAIMLDIGANIGTTVLPRIALGDFMWAFAAEAEPANATCLRHAVAANALDDRIVVDQVAIAGHDGDIALAVSTQIGTHRVVLDGEAPHGTISVPCQRLDTWVKARGVDLALTTFVKCDVEGAEMAVLQGAAAVLQQRHIAWQVEFSPAALATQGAPPAALLAFLSAHFGYFIDLHGDGARERCRPTTALAESVAYVGGEGQVSYTNLLLFNGPPLLPSA
jgi:FkbM family methyltransferase